MDAKVELNSSLNTERPHQPKSPAQSPNINLRISPCQLYFFMPEPKMVTRHYSVDLASPLIQTRSAILATATLSSLLTSQDTTTTTTTTTTTHTSNLALCDPATLYKLHCWLLHNCASSVTTAANCVPAQHSSNILPATCHHANLLAFAKYTGQFANGSPPPPSPLFGALILTLSIRPCCLLSPGGHGHLHIQHLFNTMQCNCLFVQCNTDIKARQCRTVLSTQKIKMF